MMKASFKARYEPDKAAAAATVAFNAGDFKLRASMTDATVVNGPTLNGLALAVEKPGFFIIDYNVPKKDFRFQFMNTVRVVEKPLNLTYIHSKSDARTILDGSLVIDSANKVSANHMLGTGNTKLKYTYLHSGLTTFEPSYDLGKNAWDFAVSRRVYGDDVFRATYQTSSKNLGLEWSRSSKLNGSFKITASVNLAEERKCQNYALRLPGTLKCDLLQPLFIGCKGFNLHFSEKENIFCAFNHGIYTVSFCDELADILQQTFSHCDLSIFINFASQFCKLCEKFHLFIVLGYSVNTSSFHVSDPKCYEIPMWFIGIGVGI